MSAAGWYPDPAGTPGRVRWWDGRAWTDQVRDGDGPGTASGGRPTGGRRGPLILVIGVAVVTLVVVLLVRGLPGGGGATGSGGDEDSSTPTISSWDETSSPTPEPRSSERPCPPYVADRRDRSSGERNGRYHGGGISYRAIPQWRASRGWGAAWLDDRDGQNLQVTKSWWAAAAVGRIPGTAFRSLEGTTRGLTQCLASSGYFRNAAVITILSAGPVTIDGRPAHKVVSEIRPTRNPEPTIDGDVVTVIAIDTANADGFAVFLSEAAIGDAKLNAAANAAVASISVDR